MDASRSQRSQRRTSGNLLCLTLDIGSPIDLEWPLSPGDHFVFGPHSSRSYWGCTQLLPAFNAGAGIPTYILILAQQTFLPTEPSPQFLMEDIESYIMI